MSVETPVTGTVREEICLFHLYTFSNRGNGGSLSCTLVQVRKGNMSIRLPSNLFISLCWMLSSRNIRLTQVWGRDGEKSTHWVRFYNLVGPGVKEVDISCPSCGGFRLIIPNLLPYTNCRHYREHSRVYIVVREGEEKVQFTKQLDTKAGRLWSRTEYGPWKGSMIVSHSYSYSSRSRTLCQILRLCLLPRSGDTYEECLKFVFKGLESSR